MILCLLVFSLYRHACGDLRGCIWATPLTVSVLEGVCTYCNIMTSVVDSSILRVIGPVLETPWLWDHFNTVTGQINRRLHLPYFTGCPCFFNITPVLRPICTIFIVTILCAICKNIFTTPTIINDSLYSSLFSFLYVCYGTYIL